MASRNRTIYQSHGVFVGPTPSTGYHLAIAGTGGATLITGLTRIQSANWNFNIPRTDVNQFGELGAIDRIILQTPSVSLNLNYLVNSLNNEKILGFTISSGTVGASAISGMLTKVSDDKNYFIKTVAEGTDAVNNTDKSANTYTLAFGNGFINSYTAQGSVGNFPTASVGIEALNFKIDSPTGTLPSINPTNGAQSTLYYDLASVTSNPTGAGWLNTSVLRPGDISVSLGNYGTAANGEMGAVISDLKIQSYNINANIGRTPLLKLGSDYAFSRELTLPSTVTASFTSMLGDLRTGNLLDTISTDSSYNLQVDLKDSTSTTTVVRYSVNNCKLDSQDHSYGIGGNDTITLNFSAQIAAGNSSNGLQLSGYN